MFQMAPHARIRRESNCYRIEPRTSRSWVANWIVSAESIGLPGRSRRFPVFKMTIGPLSWICVRLEPRKTEPLKTWLTVGIESGHDVVNTWDVLSVYRYTQQP